MRKATDVETKTRKTLKTFDMNYMNSFVPSFISFIHIHVQSGEKFGTRKKRKKHMRKAIDVETEKIKH